MESTRYPKIYRRFVPTPDTGFRKHCITGLLQHSLESKRQHYAPSIVVPNRTRRSDVRRGHAESSLEGHFYLL
jgi:hypothetical protein